MNTQKVLADSIIGAFEAEGVDRLAMVFKLADQLGVRDQVCTATESETRAQDIAKDLSGKAAQELREGPYPFVLKNGQRVTTTEGDAEVAIIDGSLTLSQFFTLLERSHRVAA